jgi:uncharacterized protein YjbI with pentapeptide repeats
MTPLGPDAVLDGERYVDADLSGQRAEGARLLDCRFERCRADGLVLRRARLSGCALVGLHAVDLDAAQSQWLDSTVDGARLGAVSAYGATLTRVAVTGGKLDYVNLRGATLSDVTFDGAVLGELDLSDATLTDVRLRDCRLDVLTLSAGTRLLRVDLTGATLHVVNGLDGLRGAPVSGTQLFELAPLLAEHLGIVVAD